MSAHAPIRRITAPQITACKGGEPIVSLTSYHAHTAAIVDRYADFILVGDCLGMVMHGMESTVPVPLDLMIMHGRAVVRGTKQALIVLDMPFGTYEESPQIAFRNAVRIMKETNCGAVKLEGGARMAETIHFLVERGIPVMGHIGLTRNPRTRWVGSKHKDGTKTHGPSTRPMPKPSQKQAHFQSFWKAWLNPLLRKSAKKSKFQQSELVRPLNVTVKFWC